MPSLEIDIPLFQYRYPIPDPDAPEACPAAVVALTDQEAEEGIFSNPKYAFLLSSDKFLTLYLQHWTKKLLLVMASIKENSFFKMRKIFLIFNLNKKYDFCQNRKLFFYNKQFLIESVIK